MCTWKCIVFVRDFFVQPQRLGGISGRSLVMYLWSGLTATRPTKASVIDIPDLRLHLFTPLFLTFSAPAVISLCKGILLPNDSKMVADNFLIHSSAGQEYGSVAGGLFLNSQKSFLHQAAIKTPWQSFWINIAFYLYSFSLLLRIRMLDVRVGRAIAGRRVYPPPLQCDYWPNMSITRAITNKWFSNPFTHRARSTLRCPLLQTNKGCVKDSSKWKTQKWTKGLNLLMLETILNSQIFRYIFFKVAENKNAI